MTASKTLAYLAPYACLFLTLAFFGGNIYHEQHSQQNGIVDLGIQPVDLQYVRAGDVVDTVIVKEPFVTAEAYRGIGNTG